MMTVRLSAIWASALIMAFLQVHGARAQHISGDKLYDYCTVASAAATYYQDFSTCMGYVVGVADSLFVLQRAGKIGGAYCPPDSGTRVGQLVGIVVRYLSRRPEARRWPAALVVQASLQEAFACRSQ
jgi:hypothetical protein